MKEERQRTTGIPRRLMDPGRRYLIGHTGRRWEVMAIEDETGALVPWGPGDVARTRSEDRGPGDGEPGP